MYRLKLQVSAIAPYSIIKYIKYSFEENEIKMYESFKPLIETQRTLSKNIIKVLKQEKIEILDKKLLEIELEKITLELKEKNITIYNCLFEDEN